MKTIDRPLAIIGYTFFIIASLSLSMPKEYLYILLAFLVVLGIIHYFTIKKYTKYILLITITCFIAVIYTYTYIPLHQREIDKIPTHLKEYTGYVYEINNKENTYYNIVILDEDLKENFTVSARYTNKLNIGDVVKIKGKFSPFKADKYVYSNYAKNIKGNLYIKELKVNNHIKISSIFYNTLKVKKLLLENIRQLYSGKETSIVSAIGYGDKHLLSAKTKSLFTSAGITHTLVVSGFHIAMIIAALTKISSFIPVNKKIKNVLISVFIVIFMYIIGFTPSIIRAGMIAVVVLILSSFKKEQDTITTLSIIGFLCVLQNPYLSRDIGAMLSYSASVGLVLSNLWLRDKDYTKTKKNIIANITVILFTMPVLALAGMNITILSPIYNLIFMQAIGVICVLSVVTPILNLIQIFTPITKLLVFINKSIINAFIAILEFIDKYMNFTLINFAHPIFMTVLFISLFSMFVSMFIFRQNKIRKIFIVFVFIVTLICYNLLNYNMVSITAFDSGRETSFHISARGKEYLVLSEIISLNDAKRQLLSVNSSKYEKIYYCTKDFNKYIDLNDISKDEVNVSHSNKYDEDIFKLVSDISKDKKEYTISVSDCNIKFGHGNAVASDKIEYYFLGNDIPGNIDAQNIYFFGNMPNWINVDNVNQINSNLKIKINLKTGKHKVVRDVFNFGY